MAALLVTPIALLACGGDDAPTPDGAIPFDGGDFDGGTFVPPAETVAVLEVYALDLWAQPLPPTLGRLSITSGGAPVEMTGWPIVSVALTEARSFDLALDADAHDPLTAHVEFDGTTALDAVSVTTGLDAIRAGVSVSHDRRDVSGRSLPVHSIYLGLRHEWFSAEGRPARRGNRVELMTSGEDAWGRVAMDLEAATDRIHAATWWWESDFELVRDAATHVTSTAAERQANTVLGIFDASPATKRVIVGQLLGQDGSLSWLTVDSDLRARAVATGDRFEFMGQANMSSGMFFFEIPPFYYRDVLMARRPDVAGRTFDDEQAIESTVPGHDVDLTAWPVSVDIEHGSYHQKFGVIDGRVAWVGGMNFRRVDWDTNQHLVFEPRRMLFDATTADRMAVAAHDALPDTGPRKDFLARIEGPIVEDVDEMFHQRWEFLRDTGVDYAANTSAFEVARGQGGFGDGVQAQITATLPDPFWEHAIAETWFNAVNQAERYIYIEDQYFRVPMLEYAIAQRMRDNPSLELVVITKPVNETTDPGCFWTYTTARDLATRFPDRFHLYQLRSFDVQVTWGIDETESRFQDMDVHSKILIVDDVFMSVGSCNKNNRGIVYEGELNVAVYDPAWVTRERRRLLGLILPDGTTPSDDVAGWIGQLDDAASWNQYVWDNWDAEGGDISLDGAPVPMMYSPEGFVYPLVFGLPSDCLIEGIGPDMT